MVPVTKGRKTTVPDMKVCLQRAGRMNDFYILQFGTIISHSELEKLKKPSGYVSFYILPSLSGKKASVDLIKYLNVSITVIKWICY